MNTHYLLTGEEVKIIQKVGEKFLVSQLFEDEYESGIEGEPFLVDRIFEKAPTEKLDAYYLELCARNKEIQSKVSELTIERNKLSAEVKALTETKTKLTDLVFNYSEFKDATTITVMRKGEGIPRSISNLKKNFAGYPSSLKFNFYVSQQSCGGKREITCSLIDEYNNGWDHKEIETQFGIMIDASEEEITKSAILFNEDADKNYSWDRIPDQYLPTRLVELKASFEKKIKENDILIVKNDIKKKKEELKRLLSNQ